MSHYSGGGYFEDEEPESLECCIHCSSENLPFDEDVCEKCKAEKDVEPTYPHASDCAIWVAEPCDCVTGKEPPEPIELSPVDVEELAEALSTNARFLADMGLAK